MSVDVFLQRVLCLLVPVLLLSSAEGQTKGTTFNDALKSGRGSIVFVYNDVTDFAQLGDDGKVTGLLVDMMEAFERYLYQVHELEISTSFKRIPDNNFHEFLEVVRTSKGGVFGLSNTSITQKRKENFQFSLPYLENISILVTGSNVDNLRSMNEISTVFKDKVAFSVPSSTYLTRLMQLKRDLFPELTIKLLDSGLDVMNAVSSDSSSLAIVDLLYYLEFYRKGYPIKRHSIGDLTGDFFGIIMPIESDWKPVLDEFFMSGFIQSSEYRMIISDHLGKSAIRLIQNL